MSDIVKIQQEPFNWSKEQIEMFRKTYLPGASEREAGPLLEMARRRGLDPVLKQITFVKHWTKNGDVWSPIVTIDGLRSQAEATGLYAGQDEPVYEWDDSGMPVVCKVSVYRHDVPRPFVGVCYLAEYAQKMKSGEMTKFWAEKPRLMIAKCAEALALRKAFPVHLAGLYTADEMPEPSQVTITVPAETSEAHPPVIEAQGLPEKKPETNFEKALKAEIQKDKMADALAYIEKISSMDILVVAEARAEAAFPSEEHKRVILAAIEARRAAIKEVG